MATRWTSNPSKNRDVWFELVECDGKRYKQLPIDSVVVDCAGVVEDILEGVYRKHAPILRSFVPLQFLVYNNMSDFECKRGDQGHLNLTRSLDGLGTTMNDPLIILVPPEWDESTGKSPSQDPDVSERILELFLEIDKKLQLNQEETQLQLQLNREETQLQLQLQLANEKRLLQMQLNLEEMKEIVASVVGKNPSKAFSVAALGQIELERLKHDELIMNAGILDNEEAFWSKEMQEQANGITNEAVFYAFITPFFNELLDSCGMVFVNSDRYQWLSQSPFASKSTDLKPDGFATHCGMFRDKQEPNDKVDRPNGFRFGVPEQELLDCLVLFEIKLTITDAAFGQVVWYLQNLSDKTTACAILLDRCSFWLIKSHKGVVVKVVKSMWANDGSKQLFQNFIIANKPSWISLLTDACNSLSVDVVEGDSFLGLGAHGRVFTVKRGEEILALKIVEKRSIRRLYQEAEALQQAQYTGLTISCIGKVIEIPNGAALLLSPIGKPLPQLATEHDVTSVFRLLWQLHVKDLVHGDPRLPNIILNGEEPCWIDLVEVRKASVALRIWDAEILTRSVLRLPHEASLSDKLQGLIEEYGKVATQENLAHLISRVCQILGFV
jgi:tRNA A-37 threonylcarbamoyl transferase component Bud32